MTVAFSPFLLRVIAPYRIPMRWLPYHDAMNSADLPLAKHFPSRPVIQERPVLIIIPDNKCNRMGQYIFQMHDKLFKSLWQKWAPNSDDSIRIIVMLKRVTNNDMGMLIPLSPPGSDFAYLFIMLDSIDFTGVFLLNQECQNASFPTADVHQFVCLRQLDM